MHNPHHQNSRFNIAVRHAEMLDGMNIIGLNVEYWPIWSLQDF